MKKYLIIWLNCLLLLHSEFASAAGLEATLDRTRVIEGDSLTLNLVASGNNQGSPDLSVLNKDFEVLGQSQSTRMTILNGTTETSHEWQITLIPKHAGTLTLPAISLNGLSSEPISLQVLPANQAGKIGESRPVMLEIDADTKTPYVQSQVIYTLRILSKVTLRQAELTEPKAENAIIERLGNDTSYKINRDGQTYQVTERKYAIFPQRSGAVTIEAPVLTAAIPEAGGRRLLLQDPFFRIPFGDPFGDLGSALARPTQIRGHDVTLEVKPQPTGTATPWLPAKQLQLSETWSPNPPQFKVGEPVTRTITITAQGLSAAQIPDFEPPLPNGMKSYPDKAQGENQVKDADIVATKIFKQALVPTQSGTMTLPEISLAWWNTQTNRQQTAHIPARTIEILPIPSIAPQNQPKDNSTPVPTPLTSTPHQQTSLPSITPITNMNETHYWMWIANFFGVAWVLTLWLWLQEHRHHQPRKQHIKSVAINLNQAASAIKRSCLANNAQATKTALLNWGKLKWPNQAPTGLDTLALRLNSTAATKVLQELDRHLYSNQLLATWNGANTWHTLAPLLKSKVVPQIENKLLPDLYPHAANS